MSDPDIVSGLRVQSAAWAQVAADEIERLQDRLELYATNGKGERVYVGFSADGIACRDETIQHQDATIKRLRREIIRQRERLMNDIEARIENTRGLLDKLDATRSELAEAIRLIELAAGFPMNRTPWQEIAERLDAFLTKQEVPR